MSVQSKMEQGKEKAEQLGEEIKSRAQGMGEELKSQLKGERGFREGPVARMIESGTARLQSDFFLWAAVSSMIGSAVLQIMGKHHRSLFVGQWAPAFLILGTYNKIVKVMGSDRESPSIGESLGERMAS